MSMFLGVHGSWYAGWYWDEVRRLLEREGHETAAVPQLPSGGTEAAALGDLSADAGHLRNFIDEIGQPVTLVGHSYSGMVLAEVADHPLVRQSIYVAAFWPEPGQSVFDLLGAAQLPDWLEGRPDGSVRLSRDPDKVWRALFAELDRDRALALHARMENELMSLAALQAPATAPARNHPVTYVICERDQATPPALQETMAARGDRVVRMPTSHSPMLVAPTEFVTVVAPVLADAAPASRSQQRNTAAISPSPGMSSRSTT